MKRNLKNLTWRMSFDNLRLRMRSMLLNVSGELSVLQFHCSSATTCGLPLGVLKNQFYFLYQPEHKITYTQPRCSLN